MIKCRRKVRYTLRDIDIPWIRKFILFQYNNAIKWKTLQRCDISHHTLHDENYSLERIRKINSEDDLVETLHEKALRYTTERWMKQYESNTSSC